MAEAASIAELRDELILVDRRGRIKPRNTSTKYLGVGSMDTISTTAFSERFALSSWGSSTSFRGYDAR